MLDEERIRYASELIPCSLGGLSIYVYANANGWHVSVALHRTDRRYKMKSLTIGSAETYSFSAVLEDAFMKLELLQSEDASSSDYCNTPIQRDISVIFHKGGISGIAFCDQVALKTRKDVDAFNEALKLAPAIGVRLYDLRRQEFQMVLKRRAVNPLPTDPEVIERRVAQIMRNNNRPRKVHDHEISEWQGNPSDNYHVNTASKRKAKAQSRKRTAVRNSEAAAANLPWKILLLFITAAIGFLSYKIHN